MIHEIKQVLWTSRHLWPSPLEYYYGPQYGSFFFFFLSLFVGSILNSCQSWFYFELERATGVKGHNSTGKLPFALSLSHLLSLCACVYYLRNVCPPSYHSSNFIDVNLRFTLYLHASYRVLHLMYYNACNFSNIILYMAISLNK